MSQQSIGRSPYFVVHDDCEYVIQVAVHRVPRTTCLKLAPGTTDLLKPSPQSSFWSYATGYHCATHGDFKVADTVFPEAKSKDYSRERWEAALEKAEQRTEPDKWPLIITDDFH
jgi:hypothetical protein